MTDKPDNPTVPFRCLRIGDHFRFPGGPSIWIKLSSTDYKLAWFERGTSPSSHDIHHADGLFPLWVIPAKVYVPNPD